MDANLPRRANLLIRADLFPEAVARNAPGPGRRAACSSSDPAAVSVLGPLASVGARRPGEEGRAVAGDPIDDDPEDDRLWTASSDGPRAPQREGKGSSFFRTKDGRFDGGTSETEGEKENERQSEMAPPAPPSPPRGLPTRPAPLPLHMGSRPRPSTLACAHSGCGRRPSSASKRKKTSGPPAGPSPSPTERKFHCPRCPKRFPTSKDLKRHDVVHTGQRAFQCSFCSHRFGRKDHRVRHEKKTHSGERAPPAPASRDGPAANGPLETRLPTPGGPRQRASPSPLRLSPLSPSPLQDDLVVRRRPRWRRGPATPPPPRRRAFEAGGLSGGVAEEKETAAPVPVLPGQRERASEAEREKRHAELSFIFEWAPPTSPNSGPDAPAVDFPLKSAALTIDADCADCGDCLDCAGSRGCGWFSAECEAPPKTFFPAPTSEDLLALRDLITRTKNPVLPSVYVDKSAATSTASSAFSAAPELSDEDDFLADVDLFLRDRDIFSNL